MNVGQTETAFDVKLKISVMANLFVFVQQVDDELSRGFPICVFNFAAEIAKHVWRDGEMFQCQWIVSVEFVKFIGIFEVAFNDVPHVAVDGSFNAVKAENYVLVKKAEISYWQRI